MGKERETITLRVMIIETSDKLLLRFMFLGMEIRGTIMEMHPSVAVFIRIIRDDVL